MAGGVSSSVALSNTGYPQEAVQLPNDFLILVFKEKVLCALHNLAVCSAVCKQWMEVARSNPVLQPAREILEGVLGTKSDTPDNWQWLKQNYPSRCEVFFDVNAWRFEPNDQGEAPFAFMMTKGIDEKVVQVISDLEALGIKVALWTIEYDRSPKKFMNPPNPVPILFPGQQSVREAVKKIPPSLGQMLPADWSILVSRLSSHHYEGLHEEPYKLWSKKKLMIVCSSFSGGGNICTPNTDALLTQIKQINFYMHERQNLHLQINAFTLPEPNFLLNNLARIKFSDPELMQWVQIVYNDKSLEEIISCTAYHEEESDSDNVEESSSDEQNAEEIQFAKVVYEDGDEDFGSVAGPAHKRRKSN